MQTSARTIARLVLTAWIGWLVWLLDRSHEPLTSRLVSRRRFLRNVVLGGAAVVTAELAASFVYFIWPNKTGAFGKEITVPAGSLPAVGAKPYVNQSGKFYIINNEDGALALYWRCPHLGCTVPWNDAENRWHCPCHGSIYDRHGVRIAGPAPRPLDLMAMTVQPDGGVIVDTGAITTRSDWTPAQSVPLPG